MPQSLGDQLLGIRDAHRINQTIETTEPNHPRTNRGMRRMEVDPKYLQSLVGWGWVGCGLDLVQTKPIHPK